MTKYIAAYGHSENAAPGSLILEATDDATAIVEVDAFVSAGYRNETWAAVTLSTGMRYQAANSHGNAVGHESDWPADVL